MSRASSPSTENCMCPRRGSVKGTSMIVLELAKPRSRNSVRAIEAVNHLRL